MGPEQAEWYFSVVTAQNVRTLPHLVTVAVENAAALAKGAEDTEGDKGGRPMDRKDWKELFAPRILQRGLAYYREGAVEMLQREGDVVNAVVLGRERYRVEIGLKGDEITDWSCDCPYASEGTPCKHMAAVFYGLDDADRKEAPGPREGQRSIRALIEGMDPEQAQALLLRLAERDTTVAEQIRSATEPPSKQQVQRWKRQIARLLRRAAEGHGYIEYDRAWDTMCELDDLLSDTTG